VKITRNLSEAAAREYDLVIVGGGIYGAMLAYEASRRGLLALLLEQNDFGGATSFNSMKTIHGGLRHLQNLNLNLYFQFVKERQWFLNTFPGFVKPLPVLMPLYGTGLRRPSILRLALQLDKLLAGKWNNGVSAKRRLPFGEIVSAQRVKEIFPGVNPWGLKAGAVWYDACVPDLQKLLIEIVRGACSMGATALNYMKAVNILRENNRVTGVTARDETHKSLEFHSNIVVNAGGPWARKNAALFDQDFPWLFRSSLAWNVLFDRPALSEYALAAVSQEAGAQVYFLHPWKGRLLVGTGHALRSEVLENPQPTSGELAAFIEDLNRAIPGLNLERKEVLHVFSGFLPVKQERSVRLSKSEVVIDHSKHNGPQGLFSISGVKLTTARLVAEKLLTQIFPAHSSSLSSTHLFTNAQSNEYSYRGIFDYAWLPEEHDSGWREQLLRIIEEESVCHLDDLVLRRTSIGDNPVRSLQIAPMLGTLFEWDEQRYRQEISRLENHFQWLKPDPPDEKASK